MELNEIVLKAKEQNKNAKEELLMRFRPYIIKQCKSIYLKDYSFDDLMQISYISLLNAIEKYDLSRENFTSYAINSIKNNLNYLIRQKAKENYNISIFKETGENIELIDTIEDDSSILHDIIANEDTINLYKSIDLLKPNEKTLIIEFFFKGKTLKAVSNETGIKYITLAKKKERALKNLRKIFKAL